MGKADKFFSRAERLIERLERLFPSQQEDDLEDAIAWRWRKSNGGPGRLEAIRRFNQVRLVDLLHIERQKQALERNTRQFLAGLPANNALMWGPRGTGKSSLVKALLNDYADAGLARRPARCGRRTKRCSGLAMKSGGVDNPLVASR